MARIEPAISSGGLLKLYQALWAPYYDAVLRTLGSTGVILPIGDPHHGQPNAATFTTKGEEQVTFTWSEAPSAFDAALDLTDPDSFQGIVPVIVFNGTDEEADSPDANYWTRGDGSVDLAFSVGAWINLTDATSSTIMGKFESTGNLREWFYIFGSGDRAILRLRDESASVEVERVADVAISQDVWHFVVATYDGTGGPSAMDNARMYEDGVAVASTAANNGSYVAMENKTAVVSIGVYDGSTSFFSGKMAGGPLGPLFTQKELTADEVRALYDLGRAALAL